MLSKRSYIFLLILATIFLSGCGKHRRPKPRRHIENSVYIDNHKAPKVAKSMEELDRYSKNTKPTLVYSYPKGSKFRGEVDLSAIKYKMINIINDIRVKGNHCGPSAPPLGWSQKLKNAAEAHARDISMHKSISHLGSGDVSDVARKAPGRGSNFYERIIYFGYPIKPGEIAGEIITYTKYRITGSKDPLLNFKRAVENFLRSPSHCHILMNPRFKNVGIAAYEDGEKIYWVIEFAEANY